MPQRIQMKRTKGWRKPENCVYVGRPTIWGNPFKGPNHLAVEAYRKLITPGGCSIECGPDTVWFAKNANPRTLHWEYSRWFQENIEQLRGKDLGCWCPIISNGVYSPCHADVLLSLANDLTLQEVIDENTRRAEGQASQ